MRSIWSMLTSTAVLLSLIAITGCSSGGSSTPATTVSGTAAAGAPIVGTVYLKDANGVEKSFVIDAAANGKYSIDVTNPQKLTPPFKLKAVGVVGNNNVTYCSVATNTDVGGTINITPFTDLIVANLAADVATNFYSNGDPAKITTTAVTAKVEELANKLAPVMTAMGVGASVDLLRQSFTPGTDALDKVLDILKVTVDPNTKAVQIQNLMDNSTITGTKAGDAMTGMTGTLTVPTSTTLTDIEQIRSGFNTFAARFATSMPSPTDPALLALFDATSFLNEGENLTQFLDKVTTSSEALGIKIAGIGFVAGPDTDLVAGKALVEATLTFPNNNNTTQVMRWNFKKVNNVWKSIGDQRMVKLDFFSQASYMQVTSQPSRYSTGLSLYIRDRYNKTGTGSYAVITGAGLPSGGLKLYNQTTNVSSPTDGQFTIDPTGVDINDVYWLNSDSAIDAAFPAGSDTNIPYTVKIYNSSNALLTTYTETIRYKPYKPSELSTAPFAVITKPASAQEFAAFQLNVANTITWTLKTGTVSDWINVNISGANGEQAVFEKGLMQTQTSVTGTVTSQTIFTPTGGSIWLAVMDTQGRVLQTAVQIP